MLNEVSVSLFPFKFKHFDDLVDMHKSNNYITLGAIKMKTLPKIGYIAYFGKTAIAAGFLRRVEGGFGQMDTLVSNPYLGAQIRHEGINLVVNALIEEAKVLKLEGIVAFTDDESVIKRSKAVGFQALHDYKLIVLPVT